MRSFRHRLLHPLVLVTAMTFVLSGCNSTAAPQEPQTPPSVETPTPPKNEEAKPKEETAPPPAETPKQEQPEQPQKAKPTETKPAEKPPAGQPPELSFPDIEVVGEPESVAVLVNKQRKLPENYQPNDLVFPNVPYLLPEKSEKRKMRKEAAGALEQLFAAAQADGVQLAGVSAYRSHAYQKALFNRYVKKDGVEKARTYSAVPGTSEHETGLAIDVSGKDGKCAATSCFAGTKEAKWLDENVEKFGFIIRYPEGKDAITGYIYEPWHLRYVGAEIAQEIGEKGITLEEYSGAVPVSTPTN
ncbi:D-alanyl-D-alanine carboxypeptidase family protein [Brevibacillus fortis]|uniref:M15 family metallopeptidase n=1 Tax=Brevibacillus fortis TaxID=2126352 RepID=UPI002E1CC3BF|nr:D-alanyl-D-alanine carboxypeptidase family protein [Brevibacillus fortis]